LKILYILLSGSSSGSGRISHLIFGKIQLGTDSKKWNLVRPYQVQISPRAVVFITTATAIYNLGHRLHTVSAVPRLSLPSSVER